ncbi:MAG: oligosaccharide flippase family protein [Solirubrobacterales bacterium]
MVAVVGLAATDTLTVASGVLSFVAGGLALSLAGMILVNREMSAWPKPRQEVARPMLGYGLRSYISSVPVQLNDRLDQLLISAFLQPAALGLYTAAVTFTSITQLIGVSVQFVALPGVARQKTREARALLSRKYIRGTLIASVLVSAPLIILAPQLLQLLVGSKYDGAILPAQILLAGSVALSVRSVMDGLLKGARKLLSVGIAEGVAVMATIALLPPLLHLYGIAGAAPASSVVYAASAIGMNVLLARTLQIKWYETLFGKEGVG